MAKRRKKRKKTPNVASRHAAKANREKAAQTHLPTANAKMIHDLMVSEKVGGHYKDYVVLVGKRLVDWQGSYDMVREDGKTVGVNGMALIHKSRLVPIIGKELAKHFWRSGIGRVFHKKQQA